MKILITGLAGFIGFHVSRHLAEQDHEILGVDNITDYYSTNFKKDRLKELGFDADDLTEDKIIRSNIYPNLRFIKIGLEDSYAVLSLFRQEQFDIVMHFAAQAGVRYSLLKPQVYLKSNIEGFLNILEGCRNFPVKHFIYASSSSVYGLNGKTPFSVHQPVNHPVSLYAATKKSNELMAHTYSHLFNIPATGLRFFTVYGPWGRPDMAYFSFTKNILAGKEIQIFNEGKMMRDFTYIDDVTNGIVSLIDNAPVENESWDKLNPDPSTSSAPYRIFNLGNHKPVQLLDFITTLEKVLGRKANLKMMPMQPGDVEMTYADIEDSTKAFGFNPTTNIEQGLGKFVEWYRGYFKIS
jgi:UDP-glucuronate 4-epimerase